MRVLALVPAAFALAVAAGAAAAASVPAAWQTFIRPGEFTALLADDDQVWGATAEAGLARWDRRDARFEIIRRQPGAIASNRLTAIVRDRSGRLWVATDGAGVSRRSADGRRWDVVNLLDGLPSDSVRVLEASGDTMWIGTTQGFALWNGHQVSGSLPDDGITASFDTTFSSASVTGIVHAGDSLWIGTRRGIGLARVSHQLGDWRPVSDGLADTDVRALASDGRALFAHAGADVYRWREELARWVVEPGAGAVHRLTDASGVVLVTGESGAFRWFQTATDSGWTAIAGAPAATPATRDDPEITLTPDGQVFAALGDTLFEALGSGVWGAHPLPPGPPGNDLRQVVVEGSRVYVTTDHLGVGRYDGAWRYWPPVSCAGAECDTTFLRPLFANGMFADRSGRKWVGCWSIALESFRDDGPTPEFTHEVVVVDALSERRSWVGCATQDLNGAVWFGMDTAQKGDIDPLGLEVYEGSGAYRANYNQFNNGLSGNLVHGLATTRNGRVWIGYDDGGLDFVADPANPFFEHVLSTDVAGLSVRGLASHGDSLWLVTNTQLWRYGASAVASSQPAERIPLRGGMPQLAFKPLAVSPDGAVWVGTSAGLRLFRPGGAIDSFLTANSPIPDDEIHAVAVDPASGAVWIATAAGLARFDPAYVSPPRPPRAALHARVYPNPALLTGLGIQLRIAGDAEIFSAEVYDLQGRRVRRFRNAVNGALVWDGRDDDGQLVDPGIYFVRAEAEGRSVVARVALLR